MIGNLFQYDFLVRALGAGLLLGLLAPVVGQYLVVRRFALLADTLSHVSLLGVAVAALLHLPVFFGALTASLLGGFSMEALRRSSKVMSESILALFLSGSLALALVLLTMSQGANIRLLSYLFGSITTVTATDLGILLVLLVSAFLLLTFGYRRLFLISLDEDLARVSGVSVTTYNTLFILLASAVVAGSLAIVGALLIGALMVVPVLAAMQWHRSFFTTLLLSILFAEVAVLAGFFTAFWLDWPSGATIVLFALVIFTFSYLINDQKTVA